MARGASKPCSRCQDGYELEAQFTRSRAEALHAAGLVLLVVSQCRRRSSWSREWIVLVRVSLRQINDRQLHWGIEIGGTAREFDVEIVEQIPDKRIAWRSTTGPRHSGVATFHRLGPSKCRVMLQLDYDPQCFAEQIGSFPGFPQASFEADLTRFVEFIEQRGVETGAWRRHIANKDDRQAGGGT
ncbi:MAG: SRPBCC family protein [Planctomycetota bacterium]